MGSLHLDVFTQPDPKRKFAQRSRSAVRQFSNNGAEPQTRARGVADFWLLPVQLLYPLYGRHSA